jgi:hypothetical protein
VSALVNKEERKRNGVRSAKNARCPVLPLILSFPLSLPYSYYISKHMEDFFIFVGPALPFLGELPRDEVGVTLPHTGGAGKNKIREYTKHTESRTRFGNRDEESKTSDGCVVGSPGHI